MSGGTARLAAPGVAASGSGADPRFGPAGTPGLRIGMVTHYMPPHIGGIELLADSLGRAYAAAGHEVRWVASRVPADAAPGELGRIRVSCWNGLERRLGVPWPVWGPAGARELARLCRWADVLHVHDCLYLGSLLTVALARRWRTPVLLSQHIGFVRYPAAVLNAIEHLAYRTLGRAVLRRAARVVFCTPSARKFVTALCGGVPRTAADIPYGIDTGRFRPPRAGERGEARRRLGLPVSERVVLFAGRLVEKKGADLVLEVCRRSPALHFLMVGDGPLRPPEATRPATLTWLPSLAPDAMPTAYHAADVLLLPSHGEGFPFVILEAMAAGVPVIASKGEAFTEVLEREGACLAADRAPAALAGALRRLWETPELGPVLASRARAVVRREWSRETMEARYMALIGELAGRR
ncbi:MAG: glycosyltransferase family 4 protein [Candidatus Rokubacteria bacterium]|nr:glycosyltransferase family 4 protein [Candidatus Rokubacteria bacterium]